MSQDFSNFYYDPSRQGFDTNLWKVVSGAPAVVAPNLVINNAAIIYYGDLFRCDMTLNLNIPTVPIAGASRFFGLSQINKGCYMAFVIDGAVFKAVVFDANGNTNSTVITFEPTWANDFVDYKITWDGAFASFYVDGTLKARFDDISVPNFPLSPYIANANVDAMKLNNMQIMSAQTYI